MNTIMIFVLGLYLGAWLIYSFVQSKLRMELNRLMRELDSRMNRLKESSNDNLPVNIQELIDLSKQSGQADILYKVLKEL
jgi:hypothetical protein